MTVEQAIESIRRVGSIDVVAGGIRYEIRRRVPETPEALATLKAARPTVLAILSGMTAQPQTAPLESILKGHAIELWSDGLGERFWLLADEDDAALLGEPRGTIYTAAESRRIVQIADPAIVAEVHRWKRQFEATVSEFRWDK